MILSDVLPPAYMKAAEKLDYTRITEIRLRSGQPLCAAYGGKRVYLGENGTATAEKAIKVSESVVAEVFVRACRNSVYAYGEQVAQGFIDLGEGVRMGVTGEVVRDEKGIKAVRKVYSLCIRVPHDVPGCSSAAWKELDKGGSLLVIAPCGCGKTTFLRDAAAYLGKKGLEVAVIDERGELCGSDGRVITGCDVITNCPKKFAFESVVRSMSPQVIVTDELFPEDMENVRLCILGGTRVLASVHGEDVEDAMAKLGKNAGLFDIFTVIGRDKKIVSVTRVSRKKEKI